MNINCQGARMQFGSVLKVRLPSVASAFAWIALASTIVLVTLYLFLDYRDVLNSDASVKSVLATVALHEERFLAHGWTYANGDLLILSPYVFSFLLTPVLGMSCFSNVLSSWLSYLVMLLGVAAIARGAVADNRCGVPVVVALVASGLCAANLEFLMTGGAYSLLVAAALGLFALTAPGDRSLRRCLDAALLAALLAATNAERAFGMVFLPLGLAVVVPALVSGAGRLARLREPLNDPCLVAVLGGAWVGSAIYYFWLLPSVSNFNDAAAVSSASSHDILRTVEQLPRAWCDYFLLSKPWPVLTPGMRLLQLFAWTFAMLGCWRRPGYCCDKAAPSASGA